MLIGKNKRKMLKKALCLIFAFLLSINSFAAVVSDNDGSAFITKAEFEALKSNFASQIDSYNSSIDSKIDGAIASYLAGINLSKTSVVQTGIDLEGDEDKKIIFLGRTNSNWNFSNDIYTSDKIYVAAIGTYQARACFYEQDSYDNWVFHGELTHGDTTNTYFVLNADSTVNKIYKNASMKALRLAFFFSSTHNSNGISWTKIKLYLQHPDALLNTTRAYTDDTLQEIYGYGHRRTDRTTTASDYPNDTTHWVWTAGSSLANAGTLITSGDTLRGVDLHPQHAMYDDGRARDPMWIKNQTSIQITGTEHKGSGIHFSYQPTLALRASKEKWNDIGEVKQLNESRVDYTIERDISYQGGYWAYWAASLTGERGISGYGLKFDQIVDASGNSEVNPNNIYYSQLKKYWDKNLKYSGGFPVYYTDIEGELNLKLKSDTAKTLIFSNSQTDTMPTTSSANVLPFTYKLVSGSSWTENAKSLDMLANETYEIKIEIEKNQIAYANIDADTDSVTLTQIDDATFTS